MIMSNAYDWAHLVLRWFHVMAAISWLGSALYFQWYGRVFKSSEPDAVEQAGAGRQTAHWFRRETALTWLSGVILVFMTYFAAGLGDLAHGVGSVVAFGLAWHVYDRLWNGSRAVAAAASLVGLAALAWGFGELHGARLAYLETGALLGTLMAGNVWFRLAPALADPGDAARWALARERANHNSYLVFPTIALMLSPHVAGLTTRAPGPVVPVLLVAAFIAARHVVVNGRGRRWALAALVALLATMIVITGD